MLRFLQTEDIIKAMKTLQHFSEDQKAYLLYLSRVDNDVYQRSIQRTILENETQIQQQRLQIQQQNSQIQQQNNSLQKKNARINQQEQKIEKLMSCMKKAGITFSDDDIES
jgi:DNA repair ATPase RecN